MRIFLITIYFLTLFTTGVVAQLMIEQSGASISGCITDENGIVLPGANVFIIGFGSGCAADHEGKFRISGLAAGDYILRISHVAYETSFRSIKLKGSDIQLNVILKRSLFQIGGIEVIGSSNLLPVDAASKTTITSGEIEHFQASSIKDVLELVPGIQRAGTPGLNTKTQIAIRGNNLDRLSNFGTLVVIDGTPVSTNASLQFERPDEGGNINNIPGAMEGVDFRSIPADNIESVEVLTGLPSVKYGDLSGGVLDLKTKTGLQPHRLKIKDNPDTWEANLGGGFEINDDAISYNFNTARSQRDIRITGDEYTRVTAQSVYSGKFLDDKLSSNHKLNAQMIFDEEKPKGDVFRTENYNRGFSIGYSSWGSYKPDRQYVSFDYNFYSTIQKKNSMKSRLVQSDLRVLPTGDTISTYMGKVETRGFEWNAGGNADWNNLYKGSNYSHKILLGTEVKYNANTGEGVVFDTLFSYYGPDAGRRPYTFSGIPGQLLLSFYAEDQISGKFLFDFKLSLGARYETYNPGGFNFKGLWGNGDLVKSNQGTFFNPRVSIIIFFPGNSQFRAVAGKTSKAPALSLIYPPEEVFRWRNPETSTINYYRYNQSSPDLKGISETHYEASFDKEIFDNIGTSITFFYKERRNETRGLEIPVFHLSDITNKVYYIDDYSRQVNSGWNISKGVEFTLRTNRIKTINMNFQISGSYHHINASDGGYNIDMYPDISKGQYPNYRIKDTLIGFLYPKQGRWNDRVQFNYNVNYTLPSLGIWVSLRAQHYFGARMQDYNLEPEDYNLLTETGRQRYLHEREIKKGGQIWIFNFNISKSLFRGAEVSFYVNNFIDDPFFYGIEFSSIIDGVFKWN